MVINKIYTQMTYSITEANSKCNNKKNFLSLHFFLVIHSHSDKIAVGQQTTEDNMKLSMPEIIGKMAATQTVLEIELSTVLDVYGENIPADRIKVILEDLQRRIKESDEAWENRAS